VLIPFGLYGYPDTPAGNLRTSATQLGRFLAMFAEGGCGADGVRLLKQETVDLSAFLHAHARQNCL
jgi:CubicO group peptidase (beta-lactamase class C family)